jgi:uncharacterized protein
MTTAKEPIQAYHRLQRRMDRFFRQVKRREKSNLTCRAGCSDCCQRDLSLFPVEVDVLVAAARELPENVRGGILKRARRALNDAEAPCPLLDRAGKCLVYVNRPMICRSHGLPLLVTCPGKEPSLSVCPLNFRQVLTFRSGCVLDLAPVNQILTTINHLWCTEQETNPERLSVSRSLVERL